MTEDEIAAAEGAARKHLIAEYRRTGSKAFITAALRLRRAGAGMDLADITAHLTDTGEEPRRRRGRPEIDDTDSLFKMVYLVEVRTPRLSIRRAALHLAKTTKGQSEASVAERLEDKYRGKLPPGVESYRWCAREYRRRNGEAQRSTEALRRRVVELSAGEENVPEMPDLNR